MAFRITSTIATICHSINREIIVRIHEQEVYWCVDNAVICYMARIWVLNMPLTLWRPQLSYRYSYKHPVPDQVKPSSAVFDIRALWRSALSTRVLGCQKLNPVWRRMLHSCIHMATVGVKGFCVKLATVNSTHWNKRGLPAWRSRSESAPGRAHVQSIYLMIIDGDVGSGTYLDAYRRPVTSPLCRRQPSVLRLVLLVTLAACRSPRSGSSRTDRVLMTYRLVIRLHSPPRQHRQPLPSRLPPGSEPSRGSSTSEPHQLSRFPATGSLFIYLFIYHTTKQ